MNEGKPTFFCHFTYTPDHQESLAGFVIQASRMAEFEDILEAAGTIVVAVLRFDQFHLEFFMGFVIQATGKEVLQTIQPR